MPVKDLFENKENTNNTAILLISIYDSPAKEKECLDSIAELQSLAETSLPDKDCEASFFCVTQCRNAPDSASYIGYGKAKEAAELCAAKNISLAVVDAELSPSQIKNLEDLLNSAAQTDKSSEQNNSVRLIDRTMLILDIFAKHAVTAEGKLQVEIAQLKYTAPRLTGKGLQLSRQGGTSGSIGARGPGETQLETDRRHIHRRIQTLKAQLAEIQKERDVKRVKREKSGIPTVAIAGYTNAGKSTLLNYLTNAGVLSENKLFATLDPTVRKMTLPSGKEILLSDTVGFINKLPHGIVEAFKSTLNEVKYADVVLVLADASDKDIDMKVGVTEQILIDLDAAEKPRIYVFNKIDLAEVVPPEEKLKQQQSVCISAKNGYGVDKLLEMIGAVLASTKKRCVFLFPFSEQGGVNFLYKNATVESVEYTQDGTMVTALVSQKEIGMYSKYVME